MPSLEVIDVERRFGRKTALDGISLSLEPGHVYGVIGTNGAGKTTLLKLLLGLDLPSSGSIRVLGLDPSREADAVAIRQRVGYVAEEHCFYRDLPGSQILAFVSDIYENWDQAECER
ncbi:MAG: ABC-2 type transport system ATP-binding protein, partial [Rhodothermales bacterium]